MRTQNRIRRCFVGKIFFAFSLGRLYNSKKAWSSKNLLNAPRNLLFGLFLSSVLLFCGGGFLQAADPSPFDDALAYWPFADLNDRNVQDGSNSVLIPFGKAETGIMLTGEDKAESLRRGGDGYATRLSSGSYYSAKCGAKNELNVSGSNLTICIRLKAAPEVWKSCPVMSKHGGHNKLAYNIFCLNNEIGAEIGTTGNKGLLSCRALLSEMPAGSMERWHDVVCRVNEAKTELFIDGRCYDEDFVVGQLRPNDIDLLFGAQIDENGKPRAMFTGLIDHAAVWNRALSDKEIVQISGGKERIDSRERTDRGNGESLQYWLPPNSYGVGDCMPFYADGVFHFMYLLDKGHHRSKNGLGAHQWIQAVSTDLVHWKHLPFVVPIDRQNEGSICTGSVFYHDGIYYAFYANRSVEYKAPDGSVKHRFGLLCVSTSKDGIHFEKQGYDPILQMPEGYGGGTRDPIVFQCPGENIFHMYITTNYLGKGCWAHAVSGDLKSWKLLDPVYTHLNGEPECPDWFQWGDDFYVIANHLNGYYKMSKSPLGPWDAPDKPNVLFNGIVNVPKSAPFGKNRRILCGWTREHGFGGHAVFHELIRHKDGTLGEKFVPEMIPLTENNRVDEKNISETQKIWNDLPGDLRMKAVLEFDPQRRDNLRDWILQYNDKDCLRIAFSDRTITLNRFKMDRIDLSSGLLELDLIIKDDLIDLCVNEDRTVTETLPAAEKRSFQMRNQSAPEVRVKKIEIAPVKKCQ